MVRAYLICIVLAAIFFNGSEGRRVTFGIESKSLLFREPPIVAANKSSRDAVMERITQRVDNFDPQNLDTYEMRYYRNDELYQIGGPIFVYLGGEWSISPYSIEGGHIYDLAKEFNAQLFYTEHRYYGQSIPTADASAESFRFLNTEQALADLANFIGTIKQQPLYQDSKVVIFGCSYSATMAAWFRQKYPHLVVGAWSTSAPVTAKLDFVEYKEVVGAAIRTLGSERCYRRFENAFYEAEQLLADGRSEDFLRTFALCDEFDVNNRFDVMNLFSAFSDLLSGTVQYHWPGDLVYLCNNVLNQPGSTDLEGFANWIKMFIFGTIDPVDDCLLANFASSVEFYSNTGWDSLATFTAGRQWFYQTCSEFGWYQTSGSQFQPFGSSFPVDVNIEFCQRVYDERFNRTTIEEQIARKNVLYGGLNPGVHNVYFTNGKVDPWRTMGIQTDLNEFSPADIIPDGSHCQDLSSLSVNDSPEMRAVKLRVEVLIRQWLGLPAKE